MNEFWLEKNMQTQDKLFLLGISATFGTSQRQQKKKHTNFFLFSAGGLQTTENLEKFKKPKVLTKEASIFNKNDPCAHF